MPHLGQTGGVLAIVVGDVVVVFVVVLDVVVIAPGACGDTGTLANHTARNG